MNINYNSIDVLSIKERKQMRNQLVFKMYLFVLFIMIPIMFLQEFFLLPYIVIMPVTDPLFWSVFWNYINQHYILHTYILLIVLSILGLPLMLNSYIKYIMTGQNKEKIVQRIIDPNKIFWSCVLLPNIANILNLVLDYRYFFTVSTSSLVHFFIFKLIWQILCSLLIIFFFFSINSKIRDTLELFSFDPKNRKFFAVIKEYLVMAIQFILFIIILVELFHHLDTKVQIPEQSNVLMFIFGWGIGLFLMCTVFVCFLLLYQQRINNHIKKYIYENVEKMVHTSDLSSQCTYYEQNILGSFISEYNRFMNSFNNNLGNIIASSQIVHKENITLVDNTAKLTTELSNQENNVSQMNLAINNVNSMVQYLLQEVNKKYKMLNQEQDTIDQLIQGSDNIVNQFDIISKEQETAQESAKNAIAAVETSLGTGTVINNHLVDMQNKLQLAIQETDSIDNVLGVIKNISEQTNLLSMSAAIEAAHGDSSRQGFTLVSEEIRKLAQMSQDSVSTISNRFSVIKELIMQAFSITKESVLLSSSRLRAGDELLNSINQVLDSSKELITITQKAEPLTVDQKQLIGEFQQILGDLQIFLQKLLDELKNSSSTGVVVSLNFRTMMNNFKEGRSFLYYVESLLEQLSIINKQFDNVICSYSKNNNLKR